MTLSKRLSCVASFVRPGAQLADIGSDHAELPLFLLEKGVIVSAVAVENKPGPYARMAKAVSSSPYAEKVRLSLSDGISALPENVDTVVLAGMGGKLIERILSDHPERLSHVATLIIDAHKEREELIGFLAQQGYQMSREIFFFDGGIAYDVERWDKSETPVHYSAKECRFGPLNLQDKNADFIAYYSAQLAHYESLLSLANLPAKNREEYEVKAQEITEVLHGN
jgi:tRNA (adenine22-N1)-methyltransferase